MNDYMTALGFCIHKEIKLHQIALAVTDKYNLLIDEVRSKNRRADLVRARKIICLLARELTTETLETISQYLGHRDHTTATYYLRHINQERVRNDMLENTIERIRVALKQKAFVT